MEEEDHTVSQDSNGSSVAESAASVASQPDCSAAQDFAGKKTPRPNSGTAIGILNPYGDVWTYDHFETPEQAQAYLARFWHGTPEHNHGFKIIPVEVTVSAITTDDLTPTAQPLVRLSDGQTVDAQVYQAQRAMFDALGVTSVGELTPEDRLRELEADSARLDWLEYQCVEVRTPLRYGSRENFRTHPDDSFEGEEGPSDIRAKIDAALSDSGRGDRGEQ